jgi:NIMA-interacting peptidyl-prolyl cis-trans isomerase 1
VDGNRIPPSKPTHIKHNSVIQIGPKTFVVGLGHDEPDAVAPVLAQEQAVRASHILVKHRGSRNPSSWKEPVVSRSEEEAMELIQQLRWRIVQGGEDFAEVAKIESHCSSAKHGGDLGWFGRGKMQPAFEEGAFNLKVGEISQPIVSSSGVHIILRTG